MKMGITNVKQANIIDSSKLARWKINVYGIGSMGSNLIKQLALVGFKDIVGFDFDTVDEDNIGSQEFRLEHIGKKKTEAIQEMMKHDFDFDIKVVDGKITEETEILPEDNTIYFCGFDSLGARKLLWDKIRNYPVLWAESRIGRTSQRYYFVDLKKRDEVWIKKYEESLDPNGPMTELKCGEKGCYPSNSELVGKIVRQMVNVAEGKPFATQMISDWGYPSAIFIMPEEEVPLKMDY